MLVTDSAPTMGDLVTACELARESAGLGGFDLVGDLAEGDPMVELTAEVSEGELLLQVFRPTVSLSTSADRYSVDLGLRAPTDDQGRPWLTAMAMSALASDPQILAALGVVRHLAQPRRGYLVVNGELADVAGLEPPEQLTTEEQTARDAQRRERNAPSSRAFLEAFFSTPTPGQDGWRWIIERLKHLLLAAPHLRPKQIQRDGEWRGFLPDREAPPWWPTEQHLLTSHPHVQWDVCGSAFPRDRYSQISAAGDLDPETVEALLTPLLELTDSNLDYAMLHAWHDDEPTGPSGLRTGRTGPWMLLNGHSLSESLPTLFWAQVFGPPWVELFGAETIAGTPAHRVEEIAPGHWLVQLTEHLVDVVEDHECFAQVRRDCIGHLGADCFYSPERGPRAAYRAPHLPTLAERGLVEQPEFGQR